MSFENLKHLSPGLNDDAADQTAETIINIDTGDADENGLPIDTSDVPEADIAEAQEDTAVAVEAQDVAENADETVENLDKVEEALEAIYKERRGPTAMEAKLIDELAAGATSRLYAAATSEQRLSATYGGGLNSMAGATADDVAAGLNEVRENKNGAFKSFIQKVIEFFKGIGKAIMKFLSGSSKLKGRAEELKKRANSAKTASKNGNVTVSGAQALMNSPAGGTASVANVTSGVKNLATVTGKILKDGTLYKAACVRSLDILRKDNAESEEMGKLYDAMVKSATADFQQMATGSRSSFTLIGGLQVGVIAKPEEYTLKAFATQQNATETDSWPILSKTDCGTLAGFAGDLVEVAMSYQDGWKERDRGRAEWEKEAKKVADNAKEGYGKATDDGFFKKFKTKRRIASSVGSTLMSVTGVENRLVGHNLKVAKALCSYIDASLKELDKEEKKDDKKK